MKPITLSPNAIIEFPVVGNPFRKLAFRREVLEKQANAHNSAFFDLFFKDIKHVRNEFTYDASTLLSFIDEYNQTVSDKVLKNYKDSY